MHQNKCIFIIDLSDDLFAFISNGEIIINGTGTLQIIDVLGRELFSRNLSTPSLNSFFCIFAQAKKEDEQPI